LLVHLSVYPQYLRFPLPIKKHPDFFPEFAALVSVVLDYYFASPTGRNGGFCPGCSGATTGCAHRLEQNRLCINVFETKDECLWMLLPEVLEVVLALGEPFYDGRLKMSNVQQGMSNVQVVPENGLIFTAMDVT